MQVAFIGMGTMGSPMAMNILKAGHEVTVHNRTRAKEEPAAAKGRPKSRLHRLKPPTVRSDHYLSQRHTRRRGGYSG